MGNMIFTYCRCAVHSSAFVILRTSVLMTGLKVTAISPQLITSNYCIQEVTGVVCAIQ